jgi:peroxiredoxin family protein
MKWKMKKANVRALDDMLDDFVELGGKIFACDMTMEIMGVTKEELRDEVITEYCAVGTYIKEARESEITLYI